MAEPRRHIQVLTGARQVGKTTVVRHVLERSKSAFVYASADEPSPGDRAWIGAQWERARIAASTARGEGAVLALDEIQKITDWSETVKRLWDEDTQRGTPLKVIVLGSAPLGDADAARAEQVAARRYAPARERSSPEVPLAFCALLTEACTEPCEPCCL